MSQQGQFRQGGLESLTGNTGGPVLPDSSDNINIIGNPPYIVTGNPTTNTLTISDDGTVPTTFTEDSGTATPSSNNLNILGDSTQGSVTSGSGETITITNSDATTSQKGVVELSTDDESIEGTSFTVSVVPTSLKAKLGVQTQDGIPYGDGSTNAIQWTSAGMDGQLLIGATGSSPAFANLSSSGGTIAITSGANTINLETSEQVPTTFDTDSGNAIPSANTIEILGTSSQGISTSGSNNVVTITASDSSTIQKGVIETSTNEESIAGSSTTVSVTPSSLGAKLGSQISNGLAYGSGTTSAINWLSEGTNGQIPIGNTGNPPTLSTLTAGVGITITNGAGSITINGSKGGMNWNEITNIGITSMEVDNGYISNNASRILLLLPTTSEIGDILKVNGKGTGGWQIVQSSGQTIHFVSQSTTTGTGGNLSSTNQYDCITLRCITANTDFIVETAVGNLTVT